MAEPTLLQQARLFLDGVDDQETPQWQAQDCVLQYLEQRHADASRPAQVPGERVRACSICGATSDLVARASPNADWVCADAAGCDARASANPSALDLDELQRLCDADCGLVQRATAVPKLLAEVRRLRKVTCTCDVCTAITGALAILHDGEADHDG